MDYAAGFDGVTVDGTLGESWDAERTYTAADVMNREPVCAADTATMAEVIRLMDANQTSGLPVVNGTGDLVGFVSDGDVASYLGKTEIALVDSTLLNGYRYIDDEDAATRLRELMGLNVMAVATRRVVSVEATTPGGRGVRPVRRQAHQEGAGSGKRQARRRPVPPQHHALARGGYRHPGEVGAVSLASLGAQGLAHEALRALLEKLGSAHDAMRALLPPALNFV